MNNNSIFIALLIAAIVIIAGFVLGAMISSYRRGTWQTTKGVLVSMIRQPLFITAVLAFAGAAWNGQYDVVFMTAIGYIGYKLVATEIIVVTGGDNKFQWFMGDTWNKFASYVISTKTLFLVASVAVIWVAGYKGYFDATLVSDRVLQLLGAWGAANGIPLVTLLKDKDLSFLNPTAKKEEAATEDEELVEGVDYHQKFIDEPKPIEVKNPYPNRPAYTEFDEEEWDLRFSNFFKTHPEQDRMMGSNDASITDYISVGQIVYYPVQLIKFASWRIKKFYAEFKADFGFEFSESKEHWGDKNLVGDCAATDENTFMMKMPQAMKDIYKEVMSEQERFERFAWLMENNQSIEGSLASGKYTYIEAYNALAPKSIH